MAYNDLAALAVEARKRDMTYGQLVAETTQQEWEKIVKAYWKQRGREKKKVKKKGK